MYVKSNVDNRTILHKIISHCKQISESMWIQLFLLLYLLHFIGLAKIRALTIFLVLLYAEHLQMHVDTFIPLQPYRRPPNWIRCHTNNQLWHDCTWWHYFSRCKITAHTLRLSDFQLYLKRTRHFKPLVGHCQTMDNPVADSSIQSIFPWHFIV